MLWFKFLIHCFKQSFCCFACLFSESMNVCSLVASPIFLMLIILLRSHLLWLHTLDHVWISQLVSYHIHYNHSLLPLFTIYPSSLGQIHGSFSLAFNTEVTTLFYYGMAWIFGIIPKIVLCSFACLFLFISKSFNKLQALPAQPILYYWDFYSSVNSYGLLSGMFMISISKLSNSLDMFWAFQLNEGFYKAGSPCLCLGCSLGLAILVAVLGPASASLSMVITAITAQMTPWLTIA